ncbi:MAG: cation-translocating P-type ATPase [Lachnospiraceae bacterium]|nr:cation-translocating P-type ATPase [Lachnospiraceae bacterium]
MDWHSMDLKEVMECLKTDSINGLDEKEADRRLKENGENTIAQSGKKKSTFVRLLAQLNDFLVIVLLSAAAASFLVSLFRGEQDFADSIIIIAIVVVNAIIGVAQEERAQKAIDDLKKLTPTHARVLREGAVKEIEAKNIVLGDILIFETGDCICADGRLLESISLKTEEAAITGESASVEKDCKLICSEKAELGDRRNMVLSSSFVAYGRGCAVVTSTGMNTQVGKIAELIQGEDEQKTPLGKKLDETGKVLALGAIGICIVIFVLGILRKRDIFDMFMTSVSLAVAAIPEGLTAVVTIVLAMGTRRLSQKNAIIRHLTAVETLGSAQVICSDKTGTLTKNKMKVVKIRDMLGASNANIANSKNILDLATMCNDSKYKDRAFVGEATEKAIAEAAQEWGSFKGDLDKKFPRVAEIPFSSERKLMTTVHKTNNGYLAVTKGAPEMVTAICNECEKQGVVYDFLSSERRLAQQISNEMAQKALRVIAVAKKTFDHIPRESELEKSVTLCGFIGIMDTPRPEARTAVADCKKAGIKPLMVTGDNVLTAVAVGRQVGIFTDGDESITGAQLEAMPQKQLIDTIEKYTVFARVSPEHKMRIVKAFQAKDMVVAMTGDGVNDAPALKTADIGCAMGKTGTDAAKNASDMIIADDNFATIVEAVKEGRGIYANIKKTVHFLLSSNIGEIITIFVAMVMGWDTPLLPIQLLWVNLITDSLPAIALGLDAPQKEAMEKMPSNSGKSIFDSEMGLRICLEGAMIGMLALIAFGIGHLYYDGGVGTGYGRTMAFAVLSISQLVHAYNMRSDGTVIKKGFFSNRYLNAAFFIGVLMQCIVIMVPAFAGVFKVMALDLQKWMVVIALALVPLIVVESEKRLSLHKD